MAGASQSACRTACSHPSCSYNIPPPRNPNRHHRHRQLPWAPAPTTASPHPLTLAQSFGLLTDARHLALAGTSACASHSTIPKSHSKSGRPKSSSCGISICCSSGGGSGGRQGTRRRFGLRTAALVCARRRNHTYRYGFSSHPPTAAPSPTSAPPAASTTAAVTCPAAASAAASLHGSCLRVLIWVKRHGAAAAAAPAGTHGTASTPPPSSRPAPSPPPPPPQVPRDEEERRRRRLALLEEQLGQRGVELPPDVVPGEWHKGMCPFCGGDGGREPLSFNLILSEDLQYVYYRCWRANKCGMEEMVWAESVGKGLARRPAPPRPQMGEGERQELDADTLSYFAARGIRPETLTAAGVFLARGVAHPLEPGMPLERVVAYPYYKDGVLVNVTYHDVHGYCLRMPLPAAQQLSNVDADEYGDDGGGAREHLRNRPGVSARDPVLPAPVSGALRRDSGPSLRWQVPGAERVLWGLDQLTFTEELRRHQQRLQEARRPPLARSKAAKRAAEGPAAAAAAAEAAMAGGGVQDEQRPEAGLKGREAALNGTGAMYDGDARLGVVDSMAAAAVQLAAGMKGGVDGRGDNGLKGKAARDGAVSYDCMYDEMAGEEEAEERAASELEADFDEYESTRESGDEDIDPNGEYDEVDEDDDDGYGDEAEAYEDEDDGGRRGGDGVASETAAVRDTRGSSSSDSTPVFGSQEYDSDSDPEYGLHDNPRLEVVLVEDELERLSVLEAGITNVLALPPRAVLDYHLLSELRARAKAEGGQTRRRTRTRTRAGLGPAAAGGGGGALGQATANDVMSYIFNSRPFLCPDPAVVGGQVGITLALRSSPESQLLAEELATGLARERCRVLRWPAEAAELPPCSRVRQRMEVMTWPPHGGGCGCDGGGDDLEGSDIGPDYLQEGFAEEVQLQQLKPTTATTYCVSYTRAAAPPPAQSSPSPRQPPSPPGQAEPPLRSCAGDVLMEDGREALRYLVETARPIAIKGLLDVTGLWGELLQHWYGKEQTAAGVSTGWPGLDELYRVAPGELTVVTGVPNSGKSHWLDALAVQLASGSGWRIAFASFEKSVVRHAQNLIELAAQKPMFSRDGTPLMGPDDFREALQWVDDHFVLIRHEDMADEPAAAVAAARTRPPGRGGSPLEGGAGGAHDGDDDGDEEDEELAAQELEDARQPCTIDWVLAKATQAVYRYGIRGLVIDPYNELEQRRGAQTETEYVSALLGKVKRWAQRHVVHVWLVAHPKSMEDWDGGPPTMYDISGSAHWYNKADIGLVVHRYTRGAIDAAKRRYRMSRPAGRAGKDPTISWRENETLIKVLKARNKTSGGQGDYTLEYDKEQCRFRDPGVEPQRY